MPRQNPESISLLEFHAALTAAPMADAEHGEQPFDPFWFVPPPWDSTADADIAADDPQPLRRAA